MEGSTVEGGILVVHQLNEGKHQYDVKSIFKPQKKNGEKYFFRRGDRLRLLNETELQDVPPEDLAQMLSQGNPMLTVHKTARKKKPVALEPLDEDIMIPSSKKEMTLKFSLGMIRMDAAEEDHPVSTADEDDICTEEGEHSGQSAGSIDGHYLVVSMKKTSFSVIKGRSCDSKKPCHECKVKCEYNDVVMVTESSSVTLVPRGGGFFRREKCNETLVEHKNSQLYICSLCEQKSLFVSESPERITIYYYKSAPRTKVCARTKGLPVVLNFTGSDCFLKCCRIGDKAEILVEGYDKEKLKRISENDESALAFVFYMKSELTRNTTFESALCSGWFLQVSETEHDVGMVKPVDIQEDAFFYISIQTQGCGQGNL